MRYLKYLSLLVFLSSCQQAYITKDDLQGQWVFGIPTDYSLIIPDEIIVFNFVADSFFYYNKRFNFNGIFHGTDSAQIEYASGIYKINIDLIYFSGNWKDVTLSFKNKDKFNKGKFNLIYRD